MTLFFQIFHSIFKDILLRQGKAKTEASPPSKSSFKKCLTRWRWRGKSTKGIFSEQLSLNLIQKNIRLVRVVEGLRAGESREGHTQRILALMRFGIHKLGSHCKKCQVDTSLNPRCGDMILSGTIYPWKIFPAEIIGLERSARWSRSFWEPVDWEGGTWETWVGTLDTVGEVRDSLVRFPNCIVYYQSRGWGPWLETLLSSESERKGKE